MITRRPEASLINLARGAIPAPPILIDTNVIGLTLRKKVPALLLISLATQPDLWLPAPALAEIHHLMARLDPAHSGTPQIVAAFQAALLNVGSGRILVPDAADWAQAGDLSGAARRLSGGATRSVPAAERVEFLNDALIAVLAIKISGTVVTNDRDFDLLAQTDPRLRVVFFDQPASAGGP